MEDSPIYDLVIVGSGPAGLTASIYASCFHLKHIVIGRELGGQMRLAPDILNYPGFEEISGKELTERMVAQVKKRGGEIVVDSVVKITNSSVSSTAYKNKNFAEVGKNFSTFELETRLGNKYQAKAIILATGTERRKLNVPGEVEYIGRGMHYCAACEKQDYEGKICAVVGGANSAVQAAVQFSQTASKVYIIYRGGNLRGDPIWLSQIEGNKRIEVIYNTVVTEIVGDGKNLTGVRLASSQGGRTSLSSEVRLHKELPLDKLFIEIGGVPGTALLIPLGVEMDEGGYIKVNARLATNVAGIFAAGDLVSYGLSIEQISSAVGLGARASASVFAYVKKEKTPVVWGESQIKR